MPLYAAHGGASAKERSGRECAKERGGFERAKEFAEANIS